MNSYLILQISAKSFLILFFVLVFCLFVLFYKGKNCHLLRFSKALCFWKQLSVYFQCIFGVFSTITFYEENIKSHELVFNFRIKDIFNRDERSKLYKNPPFNRKKNREPLFPSPNLKISGVFYHSDKNLYRTQNRYTLTTCYV